MTLCECLLLKICHFLPSGLPCLSSCDDLANVTFSEPNGDNEELPFNLADVPSNVEAEDTLPQRDVFDGIFLRQEGHQVVGPTWEQTKVFSEPLSTFARIFRSDDKASAIQHQEKWFLSFLSVEAHSITMCLYIHI